MNESPDLQFFDIAYRNFIQSSSKTGEIRLYYQLVGFTFCLCFAGKAMVNALTIALKHLEVNPAPCDLTIYLWDSLSTGTPQLEFPWPKEEQKPRGEVNGYSSDRVHIVVDVHTKALNVWDKTRSVALYWIKDHKDLPWWVCGSPLQLILHWWMRTKQYQLTHVAAVGYPKGGVLLSGKSGSGKSTLSLSCMKLGMQYVGEDYCFLSDLPQIWAHSIYNSSKIGEKTLQWFPEMAPHVINPNREKGDKAFLFHHEFQKEKIIKKCPVKALVCLQIKEGSNSLIEPIDAKDAVASLSITTLWQLTHTGPVVFNHLKRVAEALPCYRLYLGSNLSEAATLIRGLL
jgi:hypothetical protein